MDEERKKLSIATWKSGPRITSLSGLFEKLASGDNGVPKKMVLPLEELTREGSSLKLFYNQYQTYMGPFANHYNASIPFVLEEDCRIGNAILQHLSELSRQQHRIAKFQTIGTAEAVQARTVVSLSSQTIISLSNSPTPSNKHFFELNCPVGSFFHLGPFFDIDKDFLSKNGPLHQFADGFDLIIEDTTFQMYDSNRGEQIAFVKQNLLEDGLFLCLEKCLQEEGAEYMKREQQKDFMFKSKYFSPLQMKEKEVILDEMLKGQVTFNDLVSAIRQHFQYLELLWNSGNFYLLAASNNFTALSSFSKRLPPPIIPKEFIYEAPQKIA